MKKLFFIAFLLFCHTNVYAAIHTETVEYKDGDTILEGYLAYDDAVETKRPGVLIVHEWMGLGPYAQRRAREIAELGYVAFAADIYGKGTRPQNHEEAGAQAGIYKNNRQSMRQRVNAGLQILKDQPLADSSRMAAIGYCFGGTAVLELARSGADVRGVVSFHGGLNTPTLEDAKNIKSKVLVLHGADDPFSPASEVAEFENEMKNAGVDYKIVLYEGAVHSFTNPDSGNDPSKGAAYNESADKRSWEAMNVFFQEVL